MKKTILIAFTLGSAFINWSAHAVESDIPAPSPYSQTFIEKASSINNFEILSSQVAVRMASEPDVKALAQKILEAHETTAAEMKMAVNEAKRSIVVREPPETLDPAQQEKLNDLKNASARSFDFKYIQVQIDIHREALDLFRNYHESSDNLALKNFTARTIPILENNKKDIDVFVSEKIESN